MEFCALCGQPVPNPRHKWTGPTPIGGEAEKGVLCDGCGEREEGRRSLAQATDWAIDRILGRNSVSPFLYKGGSERAHPKT